MRLPFGEGMVRLWMQSTGGRAALIEAISREIDLPEPDFLGVCWWEGDLSPEMANRAGLSRRLNILRVPDEPGGIKVPHPRIGRDTST